jgi:hypothetical protein
LTRSDSPVGTLTTFRESLSFAYSAITAMRNPSASTALPLVTLPSPPDEAVSVRAPGQPFAARSYPPLAACPSSGLLPRPHEKLQKTATPDAPRDVAAALRRSLSGQVIRVHRIRFREPGKPLQSILGTAISRTIPQLTFDQFFPPVQGTRGSLGPGLATASRGRKETRWIETTALQ